MKGRVVSVKTKNTAVIIVERTKTHPLYKKSFLRSKRFLVEDKLGVNPGDLVEVVKIRPISKMKHWQIEKIVGRDIEEIVEAELKQKAAEIVAEVMPEKPEESEVSSESAESKVEVEEKPKKVRGGKRK
jgi:small subunit ribosomal protein S17